MKRIKSSKIPTLQMPNLICIDGAITTEELFCAGVCSLAHIYDNGDVLVFGEQVGTIDDLEFGEEEPSPEVGSDFLG